jgi:hypothetical protein
VVLNNVIWDYCFQRPYSQHDRRGTSTLRAALGEQSTQAPQNELQSLIRKSVAELNEKLKYKDRKILLLEDELAKKNQKEQQLLHQVWVLKKQQRSLTGMLRHLADTADGKLY